MSGGTGRRRATINRIRPCMARARRPGLRVSARRPHCPPRRRRSRPLRPSLPNPSCMSWPCGSGRRRSPRNQRRSPANRRQGRPAGTVRSRGPPGLPRGRQRRDGSPIPSPRMIAARIASVAAISSSRPGRKRGSSPAPRAADALIARRRVSFRRPSPPRLRPYPTPAAASPLCGVAAHGHGAAPWRRALSIGARRAMLRPKRSRSACSRATAASDAFPRGPARSPPLVRCDALRRVALQLSRLLHRRMTP